MGNNIRSSSRPKALAPSIPMPPLADAMDAVHLSVDRFCLLAGVEALAEMMEEDATTVCGARHRRHGDRRWSLTSLRERLIKTGARLVRHGRYAIFQMAEAALSRQLFAGILGLINGLRDPPVATGCT